MKTLLLMTMEALRIAEGHRMVCLTQDDEEIEVRLATPAEALEMHEKACASSGNLPTATLAEMEPIVRPVRLP